MLDIVPLDGGCLPENLTANFAMVLTMIQFFSELKSKKPHVISELALLSHGYQLTDCGYCTHIAIEYQCTCCSVTVRQYMHCTE